MVSRNIFAFSLILGLILNASTALAQATGSATDSGAAQGSMGHTDGYDTGTQATRAYDYRTQNYSGATSATQKPISGGGLNNTYTAPLALNSVSSQSLPSGSYSYGFPTSNSAKAYVGSYNSSSAYGGMLPATSTGSVDLNTVER